MLFKVNRNTIFYPFMIIVVGCVFFLFGIISAQKSYYESSITNSKSLFDGSWRTSFDAEFDKNLNHYQFSKSFWNALSYVFFKEGKDGVLIGDDGWLFTTEEFDYPKEFEQNVKNNLNYIKLVSDGLLKSNVKLFIVPIPSKARVLEHKLDRYDFPEYRAEIYSKFLKYLKAQEIHHLDILSKVKNDTRFFLKTDTHWSPYGAELVADNAANLINLPQKRQKYHINFGQETAFEGDLMRYTINGKATDILGFEGDEIAVIDIEGNANNDDLFGDVYIPVMLVGTSYSANKNWGFELFLKKALGLDILNMADEGFGPFRAMKNYLKSNEFENMKPKLVVWEIPERYLPVNADISE